MKYLFITFLLSLLSTSIFCQANIEGSIIRIENGLTEQIITYDTSSINKMNILDRMKYYKVNGLSIAVIENGEIQWAKAYGVSDASTGETVTTETLFQTASIGKVITALAALTLVKEGKITLDENVNNKLTSWKVAENKFTIKEKVTLRRLLTHSAGFTDDYGFAGYGIDDSIPALTDILKAHPPANNLKPLIVNYVPGTLTKYSGGGYLIIQQLIEDLTGMTFTKYVEEQVFNKLNLHASTYNFFPDKTGAFKIARGHDENGNVDAKEKYHIYPESAAAGFWSTPSDLARILIEMQKEYNGSAEKILNQQLLDSMFTPQSETDDRGLGVYLKGAEHAEGFWHAGENAGYNSLFYATTETGHGAVVMLNSDVVIGLAEEIFRSVANENKWSFMQTRLVKKDTKDTLNELVGNYQNKDGLVFKIRQKKEGLVVQFKESNGSTSSPLNLYRTANGNYIIREAPDLLDFKFSSDKGVKIISFCKYGGTKMLLEKTD